MSRKPELENLDPITHVQDQDILPRTDPLASILKRGLARRTESIERFVDVRFGEERPKASKRESRI